MQLYTLVKICYNYIYQVKKRRNIHGNKVLAVISGSEITEKRFKCNNNEIS